MRSRRSRMEANKQNPRPMACARTDNSRALNLALQGGGAHGAFTWGVLDRLLEDELIEIEGISAAPHVSTPDECNQLPVCSERLIHEARSCVDGAGKSTFLREAEADLTNP